MTLLEKAEQILNEKTDKIIASNIKKGVTIFDVTGTLEVEPQSTYVKGNRFYNYVLSLSDSKFIEEYGNVEIHVVKADRLPYDEMMIPRTIFKIMVYTREEALLMKDITIELLDHDGNVILSRNQGLNVDAESAEEVYLVGETMEDEVSQALINAFDYNVIIRDREMI